MHVSILVVQLHEQENSDALLWVCVSVTWQQQI